MSDDEESSCVACQISGTECSLNDSPQSLKRKLNGDYEESQSKRR